MDGVVQLPYLGGGFIHMFRLLQSTKQEKLSSHEIPANELVCISG